MSIIKIIINDKVTLTPKENEELKEIEDLYIKSYPEYIQWKKKSKYFDKENELRTNNDIEEYKLDKINLGYLIDKDELVLDDKFIKFIFFRFNGLQLCKCKQEIYLENNKDKDTCNEQKYFKFYIEELKKLEELINHYRQNIYIIESQKKIEFVKKICETINWGFEDDFSTCSELLKKDDIHPKTYGNYKQRVIGSKNNTDFEKFRLCNKNFEGIMLRNYQNKSNLNKNGILTLCHKTVEWNLLLNKYSVLSSYYKKAPFIRLLLIKGLIMPYRRYPSVKSINKEKQIGVLKVGPYIFNIYHEQNDQLILFSKVYNFTFLDETNHIITPPLLRSNITITFTEFRDYLVYLNLPVFRSTKNRDILFFPNYDLHQRLLEIQGLPRNYGTYTGRNIDWKWFKEGETVAKEAIKCFCQEYQEGPGYGIEPVQYEWFEITFETRNTKKYIFLVCSFEEWKKFYSKLEYLVRDDKLYVYNDIIKEHALDKLKEEYNFRRVKYVEYEVKFNDGATKKYLFIRCLNEERQTYYSNLKYLRKVGYNYVYDYEIEQNALDKLREQHKLYKPEQESRFREKYLKYKRKYLELKNKYLELKNN